MADTLDLGSLLVHLNMNASQYFAIMKKVEARMRITAQKMQHIGRQMTMRVTAPILAMGFVSTKAFASFDDAMTKSLAIMKGITPELRHEMESLALEISTSGVTSAKDLARSYFFLASAGLDAEQSMAALGAVERFAVAGAFDMATATDLATDAQSALGLTVKDAQKNLENMTRVTDVLTGANTLANATTQQFSLALTSQAGPAMKAYNIELEEGVAVLAAYADQGIKAQTAGNMFSRMLRLMTKGFKDNRGAWKQFNVDIFDATGELKPLYTIVGDLTGALNVLSTEQKIAALGLLGFQARSQAAILPLLGLQDRIEGYNKALLKMQGITKEIAEKQLKSFSSQMKILKNQIFETGIEIGRILAPMILALSERIKEWNNAWNELSISTRRFVIVIALVAAVVGPLLISLAIMLKLFAMIGAVAVTAAGSLLLIAVAILAIKNGPQLGQFFFDQFKVIQQVAANFVLNLRTGWVYIKYGFKQMVAGMRVAWDKFYSFLQKSLIDMRTKIPLALGGISKTTAMIMKQAIEESGVGAGMMEQNKKELEEQLNSLRELSNAIFLDIEVKFAESENNKLEVLKASVSQMEEELNKLLGKHEEQNRAMDNFMTPVKEWAANAADVWTNLGTAASSALDGISATLTQLVIAGKASFKELAMSIIANIIQIIIQAIIARSILTMLGIPPVPAPAANGAVMQGGNMTAFATGGIVNRPTLFPMANGTGLMGEAGSEAIMPLRRTTDGRLGVEATGEGGANNINIINVLDKSEMLAALSGAAGENAVINIIKRNKGIVSGVLG